MLPTYYSLPRDITINIIASDSDDNDNSVLIVFTVQLLLIDETDPHTKAQFPFPCNLIKFLTTITQCLSFSRCKKTKKAEDKIIFN